MFTPHINKYVTLSSCLTQTHARTRAHTRTHAHTHAHTHTHTRTHCTVHTRTHCTHTHTHTHKHTHIYIYIYIILVDPGHILHSLLPQLNLQSFLCVVVPSIEFHHIYAVRPGGRFMHDLRWPSLHYEVRPTTLSRVLYSSLACWGFTSQGDHDWQSRMGLTTSHQRSLPPR